jgi:hypothetical protein
MSVTFLAKSISSASKDTDTHFENLSQSESTGENFDLSLASDDASILIEESSETPSYNLDSIRKLSRAAGQWFRLSLAADWGQEQRPMTMWPSDKRPTKGK